jgi:hypothetical protein
MPTLTNDVLYLLPLLAAMTIVGWNFFAVVLTEEDLVYMSDRLFISIMFALFIKCLLLMSLEHVALVLTLPGFVLLLLYLLI